MHFIKNRYYSLIGLDKISNKKNNLLSDILFFILFIALPSSFFAIVPQSTFYKAGAYDLNLLFLISGLVYLIFYFKHLAKIWKLPSGKFFIFLCLYLIFQILYSWLYMEISLREVLTIFRKNFFWPIATLGFLLYVSSMSSYRIERFFRWLFIITFSMALLYIFSNLTGINVWGASAKDAIVFKGALLMQNVYAIPRYLHILFVFIVISSIVDFKFKNNWMWLIPLLVTILSFVRNQMMVYALYLFFIYFFTKTTNIPTHLIKTAKQFLLLFFMVILIITIFPKHLDRLLDKFGFHNRAGMLVTKMENLKTGTYDFRIRLIEESYERTKNNLLLGNGYIRESGIRTYDFVLGGDSLIPAVLFTEGVMGLIIRWIPLIILLIYSIKYIFKKRNKFKIYWLTIIVLILPQFINIVQTTIFTEYNHWYFIFLAMLIFKNKLNIKKEKNVP